MLNGMYALSKLAGTVMHVLVTPARAHAAATRATCSRTTTQQVLPSACLPHPQTPPACLPAQGRGAGLPG
jgi:hypothetical protein